MAMANHQRQASNFRNQLLQSNLDSAITDLGNLKKTQSVLVTWKAEVEKRITNLESTTKAEVGKIRNERGPEQKMQELEANVAEQVAEFRKEIDELKKQVITYMSFRCTDHKIWPKLHSQTHKPVISMRMLTTPR